MNEWNENEHHIYFKRIKIENGILEYHIYCDNKDVFVTQIDPRDLSFLEVEKKHQNFLQLFERYRTTGFLPSRISRFVKKSD